MKEKDGFLLSLLNDSPGLIELHNKKYFESFLKDLKEYTPYSSIFLCKVSKKEAPTYYDVIKTPMDLGTMTRKLALYDTMSFYEDLDLIWNNCLHFNKNSPFFINYAEKMKTKTESLKEFYFGENRLSWTQFEDLGGPSETMYSTKKNGISPGTIAATKTRASPRRHREGRINLHTRKVVKIFVTGILKSAGFKSCSRDALNVLSDVFVFYTTKRIFGLYQYKA